MMSTEFRASPQLMITVIQVRTNTIIDLPNSLRMGGWE